MSSAAQPFIPGHHSAAALLSQGPSSSSSALPSLDLEVPPAKRSSKRTTKKNKTRDKKANKTSRPADAAPAAQELRPHQFYCDPIVIIMAKYTRLFEQLILSEAITPSSPSHIKPVSFFFDRTNFLGPHRVNKISQLFDALLHYQKPIPCSMPTTHSPTTMSKAPLNITFPEAFHSKNHWFKTAVLAFNYLEGLKSPNYIPIDKQCPIVGFYLFRYACVNPEDIVSGAARWQRLIHTDADLYERARARAIFPDTGSAAGWMVNLGWADDELVALFLTSVWVDSKVIPMVVTMIDGGWSNEAFEQALVMVHGDCGYGTYSNKDNKNNTIGDLVKWLGDVLGSGSVSIEAAQSCLLRVLGQ